MYSPSLKEVKVPVVEWARVMRHAQGHSAVLGPTTALCTTQYSLPPRTTASDYGPEDSWSESLATVLSKHKSNRGTTKAQEKA